MDKTAFSNADFTFAGRASILKSSDNNYGFYIRDGCVYALKIVPKRWADGRTPIKQEHADTVITYQNCYQPRWQTVFAALQNTPSDARIYVHICGDGASTDRGLYCNKRDIAPEQAGMSTYTVFKPLSSQGAKLSSQGAKRKRGCIEDYFARGNAATHKG